MLDEQTRIATDPVYLRAASESPEAAHLPSGRAVRIRRKLPQSSIEEEWNYGF